MKFAEFFFRQGEAAKRQTIFASLCASTMRQGEALEQGRRFLTFCNRKNRVKESRSKKRAPLIRRRTATPGCRSCLKRQFGKKSPPAGEGSIKGKLKFVLYRLAYARHFPRYRRFFRFFYIRRKSEKGESKGRRGEAFKRGKVRRKCGH